MMFLYKIVFIGIRYNSYDTKGNLRAHFDAKICAGYVTANKIQKEKKTRHFYFNIFLYIYFNILAINV